MTALAVLRLRFGAELRDRWRAWVSVGLVLGVGSGVVLGALTAADRTESTYRDFLAEARPADVVVVGASEFGFVGSVDLDRALALPEVADAAVARVGLLFAGRLDDGRSVGPADLLPLLPEDDRLGTAIDGWRVLEGRRADPERPDEATASFLLAEELGVEVGDTIDLRFVRAESFTAVAGTLIGAFPERLADEDRPGTPTLAGLADGPEVRVRVVGIEAAPAEFPPLPPSVAPPLHLTPALAGALQGGLVDSPVAWVRLRSGTDLESFEEGVEQLAAGRPVSFVSTLPNKRQAVQRALDVEAAGTRLLAALTAAAVLGIAVQLLLRTAASDATDDPVLGALGVDARQRRLLALARAAVVGLTATAAALVVAVGVSPLLVFGLARRARGDEGLFVDGPVLAIGGGAVLGSVLALAALTGLVVSRRRAPTAPPPPGGRRRRLGPGLPPSAALGLRHALERRRDLAALPAGTTVLGVALVLGLLAATWSVSTNVRRIASRPALHGWAWDVQGGASGLPDVSGALLPALTADEATAAVSVGTVALVEVGDVRVDAVAVDPVEGRLAPALLDGRAPEGPGEVALGTRTMRDLDVDLGSTVEVRLGARTADLRVVGRMVLPDVGDAARLGEGAWTTLAALRRVLPEAPRNVYLVDLGPGHGDQADRVRDAFAPLLSSRPRQPNDVRNLSRLGHLPVAFAVVLVALAAATLAHTLGASVRRRRAEVAVLKAVGFLRRQVRAVVVAEAVVLAGLALLVGLPLGTAAGRWTWSLYADELGLGPVAVTPWAALGRMVAAGVVAAVALAALPARRAARAPAARVLRAE